MQTLPPPVDQLAGKVLGHYNVKQLLGHGNVNAIYAAQQQSQGQIVMLTAFAMPETFSPQARERFLTRFTQVASTLVRLDHPYILPTYDFGVQYGYPYLITPFVTGGSLAKLLRQEGYCTPKRVLQILKQVAAGLDYAHQNGIVHGSLKPATILLDDEQNVRITGFGLANILKMRGIETVVSPYVHLTSIAGTFLGAAEYIAPEVVQGAPADTRSDVYAVGIMLFELLTGKLPFSGEDPITIAIQHVKQRVPSLQSLSPDILPGLDLVVQRAVEADPAQRFQSVGKLTKAFERVLEVIHDATSPAEEVREVSSPLAAMTMPPTVNWDEENFADEQVPMKLSTTIDSMPTTTNPRIESGNWQLRPPIVTNQMAAVKATQRYDSGTQNANAWETFGRDGSDLSRPYDGFPQPMMEGIDERKGIDSFASWTNGSTPQTSRQELGIDSFASWTNGSTPQTSRQELGTFAPETQNRAKADTSNGASTRRNRRRVVAMIATGVVAAGIVGVGGIEVTRLLHSQQYGNHATSPVQYTAVNKGNKTTAKPQSTTAKPQKTMAQAKQAPAQMTKKAQPPAAHTGTVVGMGTQALNTAKDFNNPADKNDSLLVRLPNGTFTAYERACTHMQVAVNYDPATQKFVCPLHGSIFDPAQNGKVLQGPATLPLPPVQVRLNGDGTVTAIV